MYQSLGIDANTPPAHYNLRRAAEKAQESPKSSKILMQLVLDHAFECTGCSQPLCTRVKRIVRHNKICRPMMQPTCFRCKLLKAWFMIHIKQCPTELYTNPCEPSCIKCQHVMKFGSVELNEWRMRWISRQWNKHLPIVYAPEYNADNYIFDDIFNISQ